MDKKISSEDKEWSTRKRVGQATLFAVVKPKPARVRRVLTWEEKEHNLQVKKLHELHKKVRAGLIKPEQLTEKQEALLLKYFGYERSTSENVVNEGGDATRLNKRA